MSSMSHHEVIAFPNGCFSIKDVRISESMHSLIGPWEESNLIYIQQSRLLERLNSIQSSSHSAQNVDKNAEEKTAPLVIYDIGLGIASNALACVDTFFQSQGKRDLTLVSFENDLAGLDLALSQSQQFPFLEKHRNLLEELKYNSTAHIQHPCGKNLKWVLFPGDFRTQILQAPPPEIIFYDLFSPKSCPELWGLQSFQLLYETTEPLRLRSIDTQLITYSSATSVRSALLLAGFHVGYGTSTAAKLETTIASTCRDTLHRPLGPEWFERRNRSCKPFPPDYLGVTSP